MNSEYEKVRDNEWGDVAIRNGEMAHVIFYDKDNVEVDRKIVYYGASSTYVVNGYVTINPLGILTDYPRNRTDKCTCGENDGCSICGGQK